MNSFSPKIFVLQLLVLMICWASIMASNSNGSGNCNFSVIFPCNNETLETNSTGSAVPTTPCTMSDPDQFNLVYVVIILGFLLACGIGFYVYIFYCKNSNAGFSHQCKEYKSCEFKTRTSLQMEESAEPLQTRDPTTETVLEDNSNKTDTTIMPVMIKTETENSAEPQIPARDNVEDSAATQDYTLPADPSATSTYASLYSTVDIEQKKPEENHEDFAPPKIPSPYHKASGEPLVYATVDKSKKTKGRTSHVEVVYATVDKKRKSSRKDDS